VDPVVPRNEDGIVSGIGSNRLLFWRIAHHYLPLRELTRHYGITTAFRRVYMDHPAEVTLGGAHGSTTERGILGAAAISTQYSFDTHTHKHDPYSILLVQFTYLTVLFHNLSPGPLWSFSWSWALYFIIHAFLHPIIMFVSQHTPISSQPVWL